MMQHDTVHTRKSKRSHYYTAGKIAPDVRTVVLVGRYVATWYTIIKLIKSQECWQIAAT